ncbi:conjugal transfer protein TraO [Photorhabdus luminescens]|uniref:conjugal transfer protein TraO n=1 Tax=Photorhabdus luminescens TaxID=29488 RepID=UPI002240BF7D|nr:conjugal transfer protein TraO [Photorhabdus luminescens]MCW7763444.1 conjugal transfer protein TraO [Photorhabdus luminescens subsp. venezuelensis]
MAIEKDVASDGKKSGLLILSGGVIIFGGAFLLWGYLNKPAPTPSNINLNKVANNALVRSTETKQYQQLQSQANKLGSQTADINGTSFVASLKMSNVKYETPSIAPQHVELNTLPVEAPQNSAPAPNGISDDQKTALKGYLKVLNERWKPGGMQLASTFGQEEGAQNGTGQVNTFSTWTSGLPSNEQVTPVRTAMAGSISQDKIIVPPNTRRPGVIDTAIDSDNLNSIVSAHIPTGFLTGAMFTARGVQLAGNGVVIHFTRMTVNDVEYQVDAYALQDDTLQSSIASEVNNRYFSRIILPAMASGIGGVGQLYKDQNTQILSTSSGTITGGTGKVGGSAVVGTVIGGIGEQAGQVIASDAAKLPVKQVKVHRKQVVAIQFMKGVYESDRVNKNATVLTEPRLTSGEH